MRAGMLLVRERAWWFNKIPFSVFFVLLLLDGTPVTPRAATVLAAVVLAVCAVGNYGYAVNELYDIDEDARLGRANAAARVGRPRMRTIVGVSALCAVAFGFVAGGLAASFLTLLALALPLAYSIPPLRLKERTWLGVAADALAAHVFPALLALIAVAHEGLRPVGAALATATIVWSLATGTRGILAHQLATAEADERAGLATIVHRAGARRIESFILGGLLPLELIALAGAIALCRPGPILIAGIVLYLGYEGAKVLSGVFRVIAFRAAGQPYVPFVEESFYKAWGPIAVALDATRVDLTYLLVVPLYVLMFRPHLRAESQRIVMLARSLRRR